MGEVYRARDARLGRDVAIKVLPPSLAQHSDRLARFEREAKALAALNHPSIAAIYGLEDRAIVMELVEGPTLAERLAARPLPMEEALAVARQIAEAVEAAHEKGVVHRDLKPANIKITPEGTVKVLDFGLATAVQGSERDSADAANSPTLTMGATEAGVILGTAAYMSPEQASGKRVDKRADVWSFGVVLWEMLAAKPLFTGETVSHTLADVLRAEIDFAGLPASTPPSVRQLLRRCLDRDVKTRLRDIGEARIALDRSGKLEDVTPAAPARSRPRLAWAVAAVLLLALAAVSFVHFREAPPEARLVMTQINAPAKTSFDFSTGFNPPAFSPDGRHIVFGARAADGKNQLWLRPLDSATAQPLAGTENGRFPFWSPDSRSIAFFADGKLKRMDTAGGPALALVDAPNPFGGTWSPQGIILFAPNISGPLERVAAGGGAAMPVTTIAGRDYSHRVPWFLPDGRHFLFADQGSPGTPDVTLKIGALDSPEIRTVAPANSGAAYAGGYLLYLRQDTLMAQPFDQKRLVTTGEAAVAPFPGPGGKRQISTGGGTFPRWRADGKEIFYVGSNGTLAAAEVSIKGSSVETGAVTPLSIPVVTSAYYLYDVSANGQRFLVVAPPEQQASAPLTVVQNWTTLLKK